MSITLTNRAAIISLHYRIIQLHVCYDVKIQSIIGTHYRKH